MASVESSPWLRLRHSLQEPGTRLAVIVVLLVGLGAGLTGAVAWNRRQLDRLVIHVGELAVGFEPHDFTGLAPAPADRESPVYTKLKARLQAMNELNPEDAFIYVFAWLPKTDRVLYLADSAHPGDKAESLPGDPYRNYEDPALAGGLRRTLRTGQPSWEGPERDEFGSWYSAYTPLPSNADPGQLRLVLGVDRSTGPWWRENAGLGLLVTLAMWLVTGSPLVALLHYRSTSRSLTRIEALQQANTAASERRMAEALTEVERYQLLAQMVPAGILRFDWSGRALFANAQWRLVSQADATALPPWRWLRAIDREDRRKVHQARRTLGSVDASLEGEVRFRPAGEPERWVQFSLVRESDETFLLAFVDRTRDKLVERHLEQKLRIDAVTGMAGRIARDLRSSLTPAALGADALAHEVGDDHPGLHAVRSGVKEATRIVRQLVSLIEDSGGPGEVLDLAELMRPVEDSLRSTAPKQVHVLLVTPAAPVTIAGHAAQVSQAVLNLGCNAVEAMPGGGTLTLRLEQRSIDDSYARTIPGGRPGAFAIVTVADTGVGMAPETQARLLEPFFTTKAAAGHAGLGLTSVARTMAQHGGFLYCNSTPGEGTEFRLYFPLAEAAPAPIAAAAPTLAPFAGPPRHILICDDEPMVREAASLVLTGAGYRVTAVADGVDGLCRAAEPGAEPDLVLTDFEMPGLHGFELLHSFQAMLPRVPLVVMTGRSSAELPRHAHEHGVAAVIEKPFSREQLLKAVAAALAHQPR